MIKRYISVTTQREFIHQYVDAPEQVSFLREPHRHMLHIEVEIQVYHDDRELEFILVKRGLEEFLDTLHLNVCSNRSCEMIACSIVDYLKTLYGENREINVSASEDGENGSIIKYTRED